ncbi:hypothetical protein [Pelagibacterium lacus]|uniref:ParA family protein n=1 Tax=Pelagibacterium lacus TaxID=2282655 RepID=A0A369W6V0_9HYPH|nr:hypothetical protein [Pelagibacterium lacus]RDE07801.1 hypothetical protein DVH29_14830 [Pelagibacterium lacus]
MPKPSDVLATTALSPPIGIVLDADDGGVGKTHTALQVITAFRLAGLPLDLFQLDSKKTLAEKSGERVTSLVVPDRHDVNADATTGADVIAPWYRTATAMGETGRSCLLEVGGALSPVYHEAITDFDLEEDIGLLGIKVVTIIVTKAGGDAASQLMRVVRRTERNLPSGQIIIAQNEMVGSPVAAAAELDKSLRNEVLGIFERYPTIRIPRLNPRTMVLYERLPVLPSTIVSWHADNYKEALLRTGKPRDEAKRFVRDIAAWTGTIQEELSRVLPFLGEDGTNG